MTKHLHIHLHDFSAFDPEASSSDGLQADKHIGFKKLEHKLAGRKGVTDPAGLAAYIGRKKEGKAEFQKKAEEGKKGKDDRDYGVPGMKKGVHRLNPFKHPPNPNGTIYKNTISRPTSGGGNVVSAGRLLNPGTIHSRVVSVPRETPEEQKARVEKYQQERAEAFKNYYANKNKGVR